MHSVVLNEKYMVMWTHHGWLFSQFGPDLGRGWTYIGPIESPVEVVIPHLLTIFWPWLRQKGHGIYHLFCLNISHRNITAYTTFSFVDDRCPWFAFKHTEGLGCSCGKVFYERKPNTMKDKIAMANANARWLAGETARRKAGFVYQKNKGKS